MVPFVHAGVHLCAMQQPMLPCELITGAGALSDFVGRMPVQEVVREGSAVTE